MTGILEAVFYDWKNKCTKMEIDVEGNVRDDYSGLTGKKVFVEIRKWYKKRSKTANSYYWELVGKLAKEESISNIVLHNQLLREFSEPWLDAYGNIQVWWIPFDTDKVSRFD